MLDASQPALVDRDDAHLPNALSAQASARLTPAGLQSAASLARRRYLMLALVLASYVAVAATGAAVLGAGGWSLADIGLYAAVLVSAPWTILGFWHALIGLVISRVARDPAAVVSPGLAETLRAAQSGPIQSRVAVAMAIRNEDPERAFARLLAIRASLDATGQGEAFDLFVLSDTNDAAVAAQEEALMDVHRAALDGLGRAVYRRRADNAGFKAGNIEEFVARWGADYAFFVPLDADSVMSGEAILTGVRAMERHPRLGVLQTMALGAPNPSPFARLFQFGTRHSVRPGVLGAAWWQGDCGPFWGHNAVVRTDAFRAHCTLPLLPGRPPLGGHILSHDQVEAVLMRRGGYEVRVAPTPFESYEENPVTLLDFIKRELRWCNGNMQYVHLLRLPGLKMVSRFQLLQAMLMYASAPAWMAMMALAAVKTMEAEAASRIDMSLAITLFAVMVGMSLAPKLFGALDVALTTGAARRFGGGLRFGVGVVLETLFSMLLSPAAAFRLSGFMAGLPFGRPLSWSGQVRDAYGLAWRTAVRQLWAPTLYGVALTALIAFTEPGVLPWAAPVLIGLMFCAPFAVLTASPGFGRLLARLGLGAVPEDLAPTPILRRVDDAAAIIDSEPGARLEPAPNRAEAAA